MKTVGKKVDDNETAPVKSFDKQKMLKAHRKSLHPLQKEAGGKENLVGGGRMAPHKDVNGADLTYKTKIEIKKEKPEITAEDLITEEGPSEAYWEVLAERRRVALEEALKENQSLHERIKALEAENRHCKMVIEDTTALINTLKEILEEPE